jgi:c-di-GMP-binding flagellar brake protein YcgR
MSERRSSTRIDIVRHVAGRVTPVNAHIRVKEMSLGGMLIETDAELSPRGIHEFRLRLTDGAETLVRGHIVHGRFDVKYGGVKYTLGIRFAFVPVESADVIRRFIQEAGPDPFPAAG